MGEEGLWEGDEINVVGETISRTRSTEVANRTDRCRSFLRFKRCQLPRHLHATYVEIAFLLPPAGGCMELLEREGSTWGSRSYTG
jgi:hypothetical protein